MNKVIIETISVIILFGIIIFFFVYIPTKLDKKRCEDNNGVYIWEMSNGSKCHLVGDTNVKD